MGFTFNGISYSGGLTVANPVLDPVISSTSLLLKTGSQLTQNTVVTDSSVNNFTVTRNGTPSTNWPSPYSNFWSMYVTPTSPPSYLIAASSSALAMDGDYTLEAWIYFAASSGALDLALGPTSGSLYINVSPTSVNFGRSQITGSDLNISYTFSVNTWYHVAAVRSGMSTNNTKAYVNGSQIGAGTLTFSYVAGPLYSGTATSGGTTGYISNVRVVKGVAVYTGTFTPPTAPLTATQAAGTNIAAITGTQCSLLTCASNRFIDTGGLATPTTMTLQGSPQISSQYYPTTFTLSSPLAVNFATGYWSGFFNGSTDNLTSSSWSSAGNFGTGNFTVECWVYITGAPQSNQVIWTCAIVPNSGTGLYLGYSSGSSTGIGVTIWPSTTIIASGGWSFNEWHHVAVVRSGTTLSLYIDGISRGSITASNNFTDGLQYIGRPNDVSNYMAQGYISNFRIVKSTAVYTANFNPPNTPLTAITNTSLLTLQNNRFVDNSTNAYAITANGSPYLSPYLYPTGFVLPAPTGSGYFNGTTDYLTGPTTATLTLTADFTIEFWVYSGAFASGASNPSLFNNNSASIFYETSGSNRGLCLYVGSAIITTATTVLPNNQWNHVVCVRSGSTVSMYVNGSRVGTNAAFSSTADFSNAYINRYFPSAAGYLNGYMSNFRVVKGTAVYDPTLTTLTVPTIPVTAISGTSLLLNLGDSNFTTTVNTAQNNTFIDNSNYAFTITRTGTPTQGSFTPYLPNGYWSGYFDGSSGLSVPASSSLGIGNNNFTMEAWINFASLPTTGNIYGITFSRGAAASTSAWQFYIQNTSGSYFVAATISVGATDYNLSYAIGSVPSLSTWYHVALIRNSSTVYAYWNGTSIGTPQSASGSINNPSVNPTIGYRGGSYNDLYFIGYISNFRIIIGTAVYVSNFTPPITPLTAITNTSLLTCQSNRFIDNSSNAFAITIAGTPKVQSFQPFAPPAAYTPATYGGSVYSPGGSGGADRLNVTGTSGVFGSGVSYTMECWFYATAAYSGDAQNLITVNTNTYPTRWVWDIVAGSTTIQLRLLTESNAIVFVSSTVTYSLNQWVHLAVVNNASANTCTFYVNGVAAGSRAAASLTSYATLNLFCNSTSVSGTLPIYVSNFRIVNGVAVYSGAFTPPILPLTTSGATSAACYPSTTNVNTTFSAGQTAVLVNAGNGGIYDAAWQNNVTTVGDAQVSTTQSKWSPTSMKFDGTGDYLTMLLNAGTTITSGDFTVEFWLYPSTVAASQALVGTREGDTTATINWGVFLSSNQLGFQAYSTSNTLIGTISHQTTLSINTWYYCALVRSGSTFTLYLNGVAGTSTITSSATIQQSGTTLWVGRFGASSTIGALNGYIQDLRITKGYARYLFTFASPTETFVAGGGVGSVPGAVTIGTATATSATTATVTYTPSANLGGYAVSAYTATSSPGSITGTGASPISISGLTTGTTYTFTVKATNVLGDSSASSASNSIVPFTVPGAPTIGTATATGPTTATVTYTAPASDGGSTITSYTATSSPAGGTGTISQAGSGTINVTGLSPGTSYTFTVYATNAAGNSANSSASNSITTQQEQVTMAVILVAGGGGGGAKRGGGAGAGGYIYRSTLTINKGQAYSISVGAGGPRDPGSGCCLGGTNGSDTTGFGLTAIGGGYGSTYCGNSGSGGSGGGVGRSDGCTSGSNGSAQQSGSASGGYGNTGGTPVGGNGGNGGGGAGGAGGSYNTPAGYGGAGGIGRVNDISGSTVGQLVSSSYYLAGGGGGGEGGNSGLGGAGGSGGGGQGGATGNGGPGTDGTGGGGGGANDNYGYTGGNGGSGVIVIRVPSSNSISVSAGVTSTSGGTASGYNIYKVTGAGTVTIN